jgi:hypothetical protein
MVSKAMPVILGRYSAAIGAGLSILSYNVLIPNSIDGMSVHFKVFTLSFKITLLPSRVRLVGL